MFLSWKKKLRKEKIKLQSVASNEIFCDRSERCPFVGLKKDCNPFSRHECRHANRLSPDCNGQMCCFNGCTYICNVEAKMALGNSLSVLSRRSGNVDLCPPSSSIRRSACHISDNYHSYQCRRIRHCRRWQQQRRPKRRRGVFFKPT